MENRIIAMAEDLKQRYDKYVVEISPHDLGTPENSFQIILRFDNHRGVSVVCFPGSYGHKLGLAEVASGVFCGSVFNLDHKIAIGFCSINSIDKIIAQVEDMPIFIDPIRLN